MFLSNFENLFKLTNFSINWKRFHLFTAIPYIARLAFRLKIVLTNDEKHSKVTDRNEYYQQMRHAVHTVNKIYFYLKNLKIVLLNQL